LLENKLFVLGGMESDGEQVLIYNDLWRLDLTTGGWTMVTEECPLAERMGHVCVGVDGTHMLVHGGECMGRCFDDVWLYNATSNAWTLIEVASGGATNAAVPVARCAHSACFLQETSTLLIFGGYTMEDGEPVYLNDLWALDLSRLAQGGGGAMEWRQVTCVDDGISPSPRDQPALMTLPPAVGAGAGGGAGRGGMHRVFIGGGYGLSEVGEIAESDAVAMDTDTDNEAGVAVGGGGGEDEGVELGYLNDCWLVELDLVAAKAVYTELWTDSDEGKAAAALWSGTGNAGRRGCKVLASADGGIVSFGGFTGEHFSHALERTGNIYSVIN
jgi:hypothetical protein